ncbi:uncharacterized protein CBL_11541 [Carabus blaptoides fortunei]
MYEQCVFLLFLVSHICAENYDFLQKCDKNDPDIDNCMLHSANLALPHLLKGNTKLGLENLLPWKFPKYTYGSKDTFSVTSENAVLFVPKLYVIADYIAEGYFMDHKFSGKGVMFQIFDEVHSQLNLDYEVNENGYATVTNAKFDKQFQKLTVYFQGLYNGEEINSLINKNLETFYAIFAPIKRKVIGHAWGQIFTSVFRTNTIDSLFTSKPLDGIKNEL